MSAASVETVLAFALQSVWRASWQASILAALVLAIQSLFTRRLGGRGRYLLWSIVLLRLLLPVVPQSRLSVFNLSLKSDLAEVKEPRDFKSEISNSSVVLQHSSVGAEPSPQPSPGVPGEGARVADFLPRAVLIIWLLGIVALSVRVLRECLRTSRFVRGLCGISDARILSIIESCAASLDLHKLPRAVSGEAIQTPAVVGFRRPALLLPARVLERCDRGQISMIVMHELAHLKRRDIAANWLVTIATVIHWFNPLVWLMAARIRGDRELACDELVLSRAGSTGCDVQSYGNTLLALVELISPAPAPRQLVGILESSAPLERRIRMIARFDPKASGRWAWPAVILVMLSIAFLTDAVSGQGRGRRSTAPAAVSPATQSGPGVPLTDDDVRRALDHVLPEVRLEAVQLSDVMEFLRDVSGMNLVVEWRALEIAGVEPGSLVTLRLKNVSVAQALDHIISAVGGPLVYKVKSGAIVVSISDPGPELFAQSRPKIPTETVFYDVNDLMEGWTNPTERDAILKSLCDAVEATLEAQRQLNFENISMPMTRGFGTKLIITTTADGHQVTKHILAKLREKPSTRPSANSF